MPQSERASSDELLERFDIVREKIALRLTQAQFVKWALTHADWNVSDRQLRTYYQTVTEIMRKEESEHTISRLDEYVQIKATQDYILRKVLEKEDYKLARLVVRDIIEFRDLKNPQNQHDWEEILNRRGVNVPEFKDRLMRLIGEDKIEQFNGQASS